MDENKLRNIFNKRRSQRLVEREEGLREGEVARSEGILPREVSEPGLLSGSRDSVTSESLESLLRSGQFGSESSLSSTISDMSVSISGIAPELTHDKRRSQKQKRRASALEGGNLPGVELDVPRKVHSSHRGGSTAKFARPKTPPAKTDSNTPATSSAGVFSRREAYNRGRTGPQVQHLLGKLPPSGGVSAPKTAAEFLVSATDSIEVIAKVALKSKNLKITFAKGLKTSVSVLREIVETMFQRSTANEEETKRLRAENAHFQEEMKALRAEMAQMRAKFDSTETGLAPVLVPTVQCGGLPPDDTFTESQMRQLSLLFGGLIDARLEGIKARLPPEPSCRPPLAVPKPKPSQGPQRASQAPAPRGHIGPYAAAVASRSRSEGPHPAPQQGPKNQHTAVASTSRTPMTQGRPPASASAPTTAPSGDEWRTERSKKARRREKKRAAAAAIVQVAATAKQIRRKPRLSKPKTAAVLVTVSPEASSRGISYASLFSGAKTALQSTGGVDVSFRRSQSGARLLEVPGAEGAMKADLLAKTLKQLAGGDEGVRITRLMKCAELRISGLDDPVTPEEVREVVERKAQCPPGSVKVGAIRPGPGAVGAAWVRCPVASAKILAETVRLLIGFSVAKITILDARPTRCYRCMGAGHLRPQCTSSFDCSGLRFRCGQAGHTAAACSAAPHCPECAAGNLPADHMMGRANCKPPKAAKPPVGKGQASAPPSS